jgi:hypothetical protein
VSDFSENKLQLKEIAELNEIEIDTPLPAGKKLKIIK